MGTASAYKALAGEPGAVDLVLGPATDTAFQVLGPDGRPVAGAIVEPYHVKTQMAYLFPPRSMLPAIHGVTDASGRAALPALPREGFYTVRVTKEGLGRQQLQLTDKATEPAQRTIRLRPVGRVEGRLVADRPEHARSVKLFLSTEGPGGARRGSSEPQTSGSAEAMTEPDGRFVVPAIAVGPLTIGCLIDPSLPVRPRFPESLVISPGVVNRVGLPLVAAVRVRGVVRVKGTGIPIPGAAVRVSYGNGQEGDTVVSDKDGRFETHVMAGDVRTQIIAMQGDFVQTGTPWNESHKVPADASAFELPAIEVVPSRNIKGRLVQGMDRPVAQARVAGEHEGRLHGFGMTDDQGAFTLSGVPEGIEVGYKALARDEGNWVETTIVSKDPLVLRLGPDMPEAPTEGLSISGKVVDTQGKPVVGAKVDVTIETSRKPAGAPGAFTLIQKHSVIRTDDSGLYLTTLPVAEGTRFRAIAEPDGYTLAGSEAITSDGKQPVTFAPIVVFPLRTIAGRVVDTQGQPIAGASVLNWGNPGPLTSSATAPDGGFQLGGLVPRPARIFVEAPGYRFQGQALGADDSSIAIKVRRQDQPPLGNLRLRGPRLSREEASALSLKVLGPYSTRVLKEGADGDARSRVLEVLAKADPEGAWRKCQADEEPWNHNAVRIAVVHSLMAREPEDAAAILPGITSNVWRNWTRFELIDSVPSDRRDTKRTMLGEAVLDARGQGDPGTKVSLLMKAAERLLDLGDKDQARRLVDESLPLARVSDAQDPRLSSTRTIIGNLARLDLKAALALIPAAGDERTINDLRGLIGQSIAATQPEEAARLLGLMTWNNSETYVVHACVRMAPVDLPRAQQLAKAIKLDVLRGYALGKVADVIASTNQEAAREVLQEAFQAFAKVMDRGFGGGGVWGPNAAAPMAASLLPVVDRIDPSRLGEYLERTLALRWYPRSITDLTVTAPDTSQIDAMRSAATLAAMLAPYDRELAQSIARPIIARFRDPLSELEQRYLDRYAIFPALTLADPKAMAELAEVIPDHKQDNLGQSRDIARLIIAGALAAPESESRQILRRSWSDLEIVERED